MTGGLILQVLFVVVALDVVASAGEPHFRSLSGAAIHVAPTGPIQPRFQACELFYAWEKTHNPRLLNQAVADAHSPRVPWMVKPRFIWVFNGLRRWTRNETQSRKAVSFEYTVRAVCKQQVTRNLNWRNRPAFQRAIAQFSRPSTANVRSAGQVP